MHRFHIGVGPEVFRTVFYHFPCREYSRKWLIFNANPRIGLIVLKQDIVAGLEFFNQIVFQQKCIGITGNYYMSDFNNFFNQNIGFGIIMKFVEIRRNPFLKIFSFSYIKNFPCCIVILIHSGLDRQRLNLYFQRWQAHRAK